MIWYKHQIHDYASRQSAIGFGLFSNVEHALLWEKQMNVLHTNTPITLLGPATQEEVLKFVKDNGLKLDSDTLSNINNKSYYLNN